MKRRVAYFLLCACFCFSSLSLNCFAVEDELIDEGYIYDPGTGSYYIPSFEEPDAAASDEESTTLYQGDPEMLEEGFTYDPYLNIYYIGEDFAMLEPPPSPFIRSSPNFPDFNPNDIPWETAPGYIKEILYDTPFISTTTTSYVDPWKIPFVLVITNGVTVRVIVGINLFLGTYIASSDNNTSTSFAPTGTYVFCRVLTGGTSPEVVTGVEYACCYEALYDVETMETTVDWHSLTPNATGNYFTRFTGTILSFDVAWDYYCYGGNNIGPGYASAAFPVTTDSFPRIYGVNNSEYGFAGNSFVYKPDYYTSAYFTSFVPSTYEEKQLDTQKGILSGVKNIWETVKSIPEMIGEKLKSLFIPADGFFDTYTQEFQDYFSDRFGLLYELPDKIIDILQQFINFSPAEDGYSINFPEVVMPVLDNGEWYDKVIIEETDVNFDFLEQGAFKTLYTMYRSVIWLIFIFALINLIIRKANRVFGGSGG